MRLHSVHLLGALALVPIGGAQETARGTIPSPAPHTGTHVFTIGERAPRAVLGLTTRPASGRRDTLGLLVTTVHPGGPAERAGIEEGNRLVAINGVSLRVSPVDVDDRESAALVGRRLARELSKAGPGDAVELRVYAGGQVRSVRVATAAADSLYERRSFVTAMGERAAIGVGLGATGSVRDTLGVFVMSVVDTGPAARAGIEEGHRIAAINGVDLRVAREDRSDPMVAQIKLNRLHRELAKVSPGQEVELRVYAAGQFRTVRVRAVKASELARPRNVFISRDDMAPIGIPFIRTPAAPGVRRLAPTRVPSGQLRQLLQGELPREMRPHLHRLEMELQAMDAGEETSTPAVRPTS